MRDLVEFGMGRTARRTYELEDISIVPSRRTRSSKHTSTAWQIDAYRFEMPFLNHPTDALGSPESVIALGRLGSLGVLNGEGLWARHDDVEAKIGELIDIAENDPDPAAAVRRLQQLHAAPIRSDLLAAAVSTVREAGVTTAVRVSPQHAPELTPALLEAGLEILVVHGTIISAEHVTLVDTGSEDGLVAEPLNLKTFISDLDIPVIAGGVHDHRTALQSRNRTECPRCGRPAGQTDGDQEIRACRPGRRWSGDGGYSPAGQGPEKSWQPRLGRYRRTQQGLCHPGTRSEPTLRRRLSLHR